MGVLRAALTTLLAAGVVAAVAADAQSRTSVAAVATATTGLVAAYSFDEGSGSSVADSSGNGNGGTVSGAAWTTAGKYGNALSFNGSSSWVTVGDSPELDLTNGMTLEAWAKPSSLSGWRALIVKEQPGELCYGLYANSDTNTPDGIAYVGSGELDTRGSSQLSLAGWTHLAATYDGATLRLYVNGTQVSSRSVSGSMTTSGSALRIGGDAVWGEYFNGTIDDVRIYDRALSSSEIQTDMTTPVGGSSSPPPPPPSTGSGLVAAYGFEDGGGTTVADASGTGNTGTLSGPKWTSGGRYGGALSFDGVSDFVNVADTPSLDLTTGMTLEAWVKPATLGSWSTVVNKEMSGNIAYGLFSSSDTGQPAGEIYPSGGTAEALARGPAVSAGTWTHLAATFDGTTVRLYANGALVSSKASTAPITTSGRALKIGGNAIWGEWFNGVIDEVRVYNRPLSASEIQSDLNTPVTSGSVVPPTDTTAPSTPTGLTATASTQTSISVAWTASTDNIGVAGYGVYKDGAAAGSATATTYTFSNLACGTSYTLAVDAYDAAGNRSAKVQVTASTAPCTPAGDTTAPTTPTGLGLTGTTPTSLAVAWSASSDDVGVAGYGVYRNGASVGSTASTSYTYSGLACGTSYTLAVDAYDAAGNRSGKAQLTAATSACSVSSANVFLSPSGSDSNACTQSAPCRSFQRGYDIAQPGQVVQLAGGSYGNQTVNGTKASPKVIFQPASGASVNVSDLEIYADNLEVRSITTGFWATHAGSDGATLRNVDTGPFIIFGSSNTSVIGGDVGPSYGNGSATNDAFITYDNGTTAPTNVLIDGVYFHDFKLGYVGDHGQCLQVVGGNGITFRNNRFQRCDGYSIFFTQWAGPAPPQNILLENNFFDQSTNYGTYTTCCTYYAIQFAAHMSYFKNITLRNNSFLQLVSFERGPSISNVQMIANIAPMDVCVSGIVYAYNVFNGPRCGATDKSAAPGFVNPSTLDLHLTAGSAAINAGDPTNYPSTDIDGDARPRGSAPDAGADEAG